MIVFLILVGFWAGSIIAFAGLLVFLAARSAWQDRDARRRILVLLEQERMEAWYEMPAAPNPRGFA